MSFYFRMVTKVCFKTIRFGFLLLIIPLLFSCSNKRSILFRINEGNAVKSTLNDSATTSITFPRLIQAGDYLTITNINNETLINGLGSSTPIEIKYQVDLNGKIKLPVIGEIPLAGLSIEEAETYLTKAYQTTALANPIFVITILNSKVTLLGEFFKQGNFPLENQYTSLVDIIGDAGGFNQRADKTNVKIIRGDKKNPEVIDVDLSNIASLASPKLQLRNGDIIYCQPRNIYLFSDKITPILSYVGAGTSIISLIFLLSRKSL